MKQEMRDGMRYDFKKGNDPNDGDAYNRFSNMPEKSHVSRENEGKIILEIIF